MGLDLSHGAFSGPYSYFMRFREALMRTIPGAPPLRSMEGFNGNESWLGYEDHDLYPLLDHSDCDGKLTVAQCKRVVRGLQTALPILRELPPDDREDVVEDAERMIEGLELAIDNDEEVIFG